jgi:hypothetical protein
MLFIFSKSTPRSLAISMSCKRIAFFDPTSNLENKFKNVVGIGAQKRG